MKVREGCRYSFRKGVKGVVFSLECKVYLCRGFREFERLLGINYSLVVYFVVVEIRLYK